MQAQSDIENGKGLIKLTGRFDFNAHRTFRSAYESVIDDARVRAVSVDLANVDYLDSSALGMLLMLRDKAAAAGKSVSLANARGAVKQVLDIANFRKLFPIN